MIALGSNMGGKWGTPDAVLERALLALDKNGITVVARSRLWRSKAWPDPGEAEYRNAVAIVETMLDPPSLLAELHAMEGRFGRERSIPNAPRTLDLDLIAYGRVIRDTDPVLPHPRATDRRFVMGPLAELLPDWIDPATGATAGALAILARVGLDAAPIS